MTATGSGPSIPRSGHVAPPAPRVQALEDLRQKMHQFVVQELGPPPLRPAALRSRDPQAGRGAAPPAWPKSASRSAPPTTGAGPVGLRRILGYGPIDRLLRTRTSARSWSTAPSGSSSNATARSPSPTSTSSTRPPAAHHRQDRQPGRPPRRRGDPDGRRPPPRRLPVQRHRAPLAIGGPVPHHPPASAPTRFTAQEAGRDGDHDEQVARFTGCVSGAASTSWSAAGPAPARPPC